MSYITTYSGLDFDYLKPVASSICIEDNRIYDAGRFCAGNNGSQ
ncbi:Uncharacterised protein [Yersinia mollaretii]|nr:Uncharacterised protein [Yersinia mollaretii]